MPKLTKSLVIKNSDDREKKMNNKTSHPPYQLKHLGEIVWPYDSLFYDYNIKSVLDIGANMGEYSSFLKSRHNDCKFFCIEANPYCEPYLKKTGLDYKIITLSNNQKEVSLFLDNIDDVSSGTSYYREINDETFGNNRHIKVKTNTLDNVINDKFDGYPLFDFIKMDTQGSELDILQGGRETIKKCRFLLVEVSIKPYNRLAPLAKEVDDYIVNLGFIKRSTADVLILEDVIHQEDWLYENHS